MRGRNFSARIFSRSALSTFLQAAARGLVFIKAILWGNIVLHILAIAADANAYMNHIINLQGIMQSTVVHLVFIIGFCYFTFVKSTHDMSTAKHSANSKLPDAA